MNYKGILHLEGEKYLISRDTSKIGSFPHCHIHLEHPSIEKIHVRLDWTRVGLVITNLAGNGKTFLNNIPMTPLEAQQLRNRETIIKLGELEGHLSLHSEARKVARASFKEYLQVNSNPELTSDRKNQNMKIRAVFDQRRKFRLKFDMPRRQTQVVKYVGRPSCRRQPADDQTFYNSFSHLSLFPQRD